jgi:hypothetical protein
MIGADLIASLALNGRETGELAVAGVVVLEVVVAVMAYQESNRFRWQHGTTPLGRPSWFWAVVGFFLSLLAAFPLWRARVVTMRRLGRTSADPPVELTRWLAAQPAPGAPGAGGAAGAGFAHGPLPEQTIAPAVAERAPNAAGGPAGLAFPGIVGAGGATPAGATASPGGGAAALAGGSDALTAGGGAAAAQLVDAANGAAHTNGSGAFGAGALAAADSEASAAVAASQAASAAGSQAAATGGGTFSRLSVQPAADWYADPLNRHELRYWDGTAWTHWVNDAGVTETDPLV